MKNWRKLIGWILIILPIIVVATNSAMMSNNGYVGLFIVFIIGIIYKSRSRQYCNRCGTRGNYRGREVNNIIRTTTIDSDRTKATSTYEGDITDFYECSNCENRWSSTTFRKTV